MVAQPITINQLITQAIERYRHKTDWLNYKQEGRWHAVSADQLAEQVRAVALGLYARGIRPGERVAILSENRLEWNLADMGALMMGAVVVPIYATQAPAQVEYILRDSEARLLFISTPAQRERISDVLARLPALSHLVTFDAINQLEPLSKLQADGIALAAAQPDLYDQLWQAVKPADLATLIYTSGTTGEPKGVMLTHWNIASNVLAVADVLNYADNDITLSFLPFSHIFERAAFYGYLHQGVQIYYAESLEAVPRNLLEVRPTVLVTVPRVFEKIYEQIAALAQQASPLKKRLFSWAVAIGKQYAKRHARGAVGPLLRWQYKLAYRLVLSRWRPRLGMDRLRCVISGGAPLSPDLAYIFRAAGVEILQGYGLSETSPGVTLNRPDANRIGTSGQPLGGVEVRIAEDGEVLVRGPNVMQGYYRRDEDNRQAFTEDGWFRTGDIGQIDEDGYLTITDRKKDLIKTSGGKYVAPQPIEGRLKLNPYVAEAVVIGNARKFPSALIVPNMELLQQLAQQQQISYHQPQELLAHPEVAKLFEQIIQDSNQTLSRHEQIKRFVLLHEPFSVQNGQLTPTMKVRRQVVEQQYREVIEKLYGDSSISY